MLFKYVNKSLVKIINIMLVIFFMISIFQVSYAENYEWTVIDNIDTIETNSTVESEDNSAFENTSKTVKEELSLECESAILIEQTTRSNIIRKKFT